MTQRQDAPTRTDEPAALFDGAFRLVAVLAAILVLLVVVRLAAEAVGPGRGGSTPGGAAAASVSPSAGASGPAAPIDVTPFLTTDAGRAPELALTGPDGQAMSLASLRGVPVLVFFGYTHCADVCPATIGTVGVAIDAYGQAAKAIFVSIDPERDTVPWLAQFVRYMPTGFTAVTGTPIQVRSTADAWGVRYAKVVGDDPVNYEMSHTADVFLVDAAGNLRALFPFGTEAETMTAVMRAVAATSATPTSTPAPSPTATPAVTPPPTPTPTPSAGGPSAPPSVADLWPRVVSSSVWAGGSSPVILALYDGAGARIDDPSLHVTAQLLDGSGTRTGPVVAATTIQPIGVAEVSYVPTMDLPAPGRVRLAVDATASDGTIHTGIVELTALDPGGTPALGGPAPTVRTPVAADYSDPTWVTTDPLPDPRLSRTSTVDALAAHEAFVLVVDSVRFRVTPVCGRAVVLAKELADRWTEIPFIHLEPYRYTVITTEPVLEGTLADPQLTDPAEAWGVGAAPWGVKSMPWIFIVDGSGTIRAKYQGVIGSADVDVILTLLAKGS